MTSENYDAFGFQGPYGEHGERERRRRQEDARRQIMMEQDRRQKSAYGAGSKSVHSPFSRWFNFHGCKDKVRKWSSSRDASKIILKQVDSEWTWRAGTLCWCRYYLRPVREASNCRVQSESGSIILHLEAEKMIYLSKINEEYKKEKTPYIYHLRW